MQVNMDEAKSQLSMLTEKALNGDTVVIAKSGKPLVRLVPFVQEIESRIPGQFKGQVQVSEDFDNLNEDIEVMFYGE